MSPWWGTEGPPKMTSTPTSTSTPLRVLIVDDDELYREALALAVSLEPDLTLVGVAGNGLEALAEVARLRPELVFMDLRMPIMDGLEATRAIKSLPRPPFVAICTAEPRGSWTASGHGADAILSKGELTAESIQLLARSLRPGVSEAAPVQRLGTSPQS
jgi:CheY-like chemotaxis protein